MLISSTFTALACDYDGTLARAGRVHDDVVLALARFRDSGRNLVLVTGRQLDELRSIFPELQLFDRVVAENGALLYRPKSGHLRAFVDRPPRSLIRALRRRRVEPLSVGRAIVATSRSHAKHVRTAIRELGLAHTLIHNKDSVMVLPPEVNKATGLSHALNELQVPLANTIGIGDAENDREFLSACGCAVAVANALPSLRRNVHHVTQAKYGAGVVEVIDRVLSADNGSHH